MRSAATSVSVFQWPCGTLATGRSPRGERPRCRTILVVTAVSSIKTRHGARSFNCSTFSLARAAATSGQSCSAACRIFFERDVMALVEAPDRRRTGFQPLLGLEPRAYLFQRQVRLRCDQIKQPLAMRLKRRAAVARAGRCRYTARRRPAFEPADCGRGAQTSTRAASRLLSPSSTSATARAPEVLRISLCHRATPSLLSSDTNLICAPWRTPLLFRFTSIETALERAARPGGRANASSSVLSPSILRRISRIMRPSRLRNCRLNCLARGIAARHHRRALGDPAGRLPQPHAVPGRLKSPLIAACSSLASVGKVMAFGCTVRSRRISHREEVAFLDFISA